METIAENYKTGQESKKTASEGRRAASPGVPSESGFFISELDTDYSSEIGFPYLDIEKSQSRRPNFNDSLVVFTALKCKCNCSWCPRCFVARVAPKISKRISSMNWQSTRQIILTVDPRKFENDPRKAYEYLVREKKSIPQFMRDLQRTAGVKVSDWVRVLEWHKNGFPHWHIFVDVGVEGKKGMIGHDILKSYWSYGGCAESPIKSEKHFRKLTGYFGKFGYFSSDKAHQAKLPEWALLSNFKIRRYDSARPQKTDSDVLPDSDLDDSFADSVSDEEDDSNSDDWRGYASAMSECGSETLVQYRDSCRFGKFSIPFEYFRSLPGEYVEGKGYVVEIWESDFLEFLQKYPGSLHHYHFEKSIDRNYENYLSTLLN